MTKQTEQNPLLGELHGYSNLDSTIQILLPCFAYAATGYQSSKMGCHPRFCHFYYKNSRRVSSSNIEPSGDIDLCRRAAVPPIDVYLLAILTFFIGQ